MSISKLAKLLVTIKYLRYNQIIYQVAYKLYHPQYIRYECDIMPKCLLKLSISRPIYCYDLTFKFLNLSDGFNNWNFADNGMLWAYNLNYMDWLGQEGMKYEEGAKWIDKFIDELPDNKVGLEPYPIALRGINWIKFICKHGERIEADRMRRWNDSLYSQYKLLEKKLEWHLLGNHLLEDAYSLFIASIYFRNTKMYRRYFRLLKQELNEQILDDGAHYEQSPMYHCILLDRLLDCYNISKNNIYFEGQDSVNLLLEGKASLMLGHLESIVYDNGDIPLLNDSAYGIAPSAKQLFDYAKRLGINWVKQPLKECGYRRISLGKFEAIVDVGNVTASYQPGHTHADSLNYELRIDGQPCVIDTGISTYNKTARRQFERSTVAHNCVSPSGKDSSEVWGGFRVGRRCQTEIIEETQKSIVACHDGFAKVCKRKFELSESGFVVEDWYADNAVSYIHLAEGTDPQRILVEGADSVEIKDYQYSTEYNRFHNGKVIEIHFTGYLKYIVR